MKKSTFLGGTVSVLLLFSVISYSRTYIQQQDPKPVTQSNQSPNQSSHSAADASAPTTPAGPALAKSADVATAVDKASAGSLKGETYSATAYSLRGRTASGKPVARGLIAADPRFLPMGTRVRIESGDFSGEYEVADTGGAVKGRRIDSWTPTSREAMRFGRRLVKLTVLERGGRKSAKATVRERRATPIAPATTVSEAAAKQDR